MSNKDPDKHALQVFFQRKYKIKLSDSYLKEAQSSMLLLGKALVRYIQLKPMQLNLPIDSCEDVSPADTRLDSNVISLDSRFKCNI